MIQHKPFEVRSTSYYFAVLTTIEEGKFPFFNYITRPLTNRRRGIVSTWGVTGSGIRFHRRRTPTVQEDKKSLFGFSRGSRNLSVFIDFLLDFIVDSSAIVNVYE